MICPTCYGTGYDINDGSPILCPTCHGHCRTHCCEGEDLDQAGCADEVPNGLTRYPTRREQQVLARALKKSTRLIAEG